MAGVSWFSTTAFKDPAAWAGGSTRFQGTIAEVYLSPVAQSAAWIAATYRAGPPT